MTRTDRLIESIVAVLESHRPMLDIADGLTKVELSLEINDAGFGRHGWFQPRFAHDLRGAKLTTMKS